MLEHGVEISDSDREKVLSSTFESFEPLRLEVYSGKFKKKLIILDRIIEEFDADKKYTEQEVNDILKPIFSDFATIRRDMIELGYMSRTRDCSQYWLGTNE